MKWKGLSVGFFFLFPVWHHFPPAAQPSGAGLPSIIVMAFKWISVLMQNVAQLWISVLPAADAVQSHGNKVSECCCQAFLRGPA